LPIRLRCRIISSVGRAGGFNKSLDCVVVIRLVKSLRNTIEIGEPGVVDSFIQFNENAKLRQPDNGFKYLLSQIS